MNILIMFGKKAAKYKFPWLVGIIRDPHSKGEFYSHKINGDILCGGSLISRSCVLTAGHCLFENNTFVNRVVLGEHDIMTPGTA